MALIVSYKVVGVIWVKLSSVICIKENIVVIFLCGMYGQLFDPAHGQLFPGMFEQSHGLLWFLTLI